MKPIFVLTFTSMMLVFTAAHASHEGHDHSSEQATVSPKATPETDCKNAVKVKVNGLVCDFCARALEKVFSKHEEVDHIKVDLQDGHVTVSLKDGKTLDDATITKLITDSGYNVQGMTKGC